MWFGRAGHTDVQRSLLGMVVLFAVKRGPHQFNTLCIRACNCSCRWTGEGGDKNGCPEGDECRVVLVTQETRVTQQTQTTTIPLKILHQQFLSPSAELTLLVLYIYSFPSHSLCLQSSNISASHWQEKEIKIHCQTQQ